MKYRRSVKSRTDFPVEVIALSLLFIAATVGVLIPNKILLSLIGIIGACIALWMTVKTFINLQHGRAVLGLFILNLGSIFWFWQEVLVLSLTSPLFLNISTISPIAGETIDVALIAEGLFVLSLFALSATLTWFLSKQFLNKFFIYSRKEGKTYLFEVSLLLLALTGWVPFWKNFGGIGNALNGLLAMREASIELDASLANYLPIVSISAAGFALSRLVSGTSKSTAISILTVIIGGLLAVLSGTRFKLIYLLAPSLICSLVGLQQRNNRFRSLVFLGIGLCAVIILAAFQFVNRYGTGGEDSSLLLAIAGAQHFTALIFSIYLMQSEPLFHQSMAVLFVTDFVPRFIWSGKPSHEYWDFYNQLAPAGNVTPSILGQYYLNWGIVGGASAGIIMGAWARLADILYARYLVSNNSMFLILSAYICTFIFLSFRQYTANYVTYLLVVAFIFFIFAKPVRRKRSH